MLEALLLTTDRQGLFNGDLHFVQRIGLQWLMNKEISDQVDLERYRMQMNALASNARTSPALIKSLIEQEEQEVAEEVAWVTPTSQAELDRVLDEWGIDLS